MKIMLTGASGFIGSYLVNCLSTDHEVMAIYRDGNRPACNPKVTSIEHRLEKQWDFNYKPDVIIYCAAQHVMSRTSATARNYINSNVLGLLNAAEFAKKVGVRKFIFFSTVTVHGKVQSAILNEHSPLNSPNLYGVTKYAGEEILRSFVDVPTTIVRLPGVVGPGTAWNRPWLSTVLRRALDGDHITYRNPQGLFNNVTDLHDISRFVSHLLAEHLSRDIDTVYLAAQEPIPVCKVIDILVSEVKSKSIQEIVETDGTSFTIDTSHLIEYYGFTPSRTVDILLNFVRNVTSDTP